MYMTLFTFKCIYTWTIYQNQNYQNLSNKFIKSIWIGWVHLHIELFALEEVLAFAKECNYIHPNMMYYMLIYALHTSSFRSSKNMMSALLNCYHLHVSARLHSPSTSNLYCVTWFSTCVHTIRHFGKRGCTKQSLMITIHL